MPKASQKSKKTEKACACCGAPLRAGIEHTHITGLGFVGPVCESEVMAHLPHLFGAGLGVFLTQGHVTLELVQQGDAWSLSANPAYTDLVTRAGRVGLELTMNGAPTMNRRGRLEAELILKPSTVKAYFARAQRSAA